MSRRNAIIAAVIGLSAAPAWAGVTEVTMPLLATDLHFQFAPGTCPKKMAVGAIGAPARFSYPGCNGDVFEIRFAYGDPQPTALALFGIFNAGAPETVRRKTLTIVDAWWTRNEGTFYLPVWTDAQPRVMVVPEPATWALLLAGFGLVGGRLRRRRALTAV